MIYLEVRKDGEYIASKWKRRHDIALGKRMFHNIKGTRFELPKGTIKALIGREITQDDGPVKISNSYTDEEWLKLGMTLKCKSCIYKQKNKHGIYYCSKRHIRVGINRKFCELYEPK